MSNQENNCIKATWLQLNNFGDILTPHILKHFTGREVCFVDKNQVGKVVGVGSIMSCMRDGDVLFGTGTIESGESFKADDVSVIAVRGPLTRASLDLGYDIPEVYGDPAMLLPLMYDPEVEKIYDVGYIPHYVDKIFVEASHDFEKENAILIDLAEEGVATNWRKVIDQVKQCKKIVSSSLHGIIVAEAYSIPTIWESYSKNVIGGNHKFNDYFLGTGRTPQQKGRLLSPILEVEKLRKTLINSINNHFHD